MNCKTFLRLSALFLLLTVVLSGIGLAETIRYLNSTDGDDSYSGVNPINDPPGTGPKRTLEGAFAAFPSGTVVIMTAGTYNLNQSGIPGGGNDADGVTLGTGATKSMTFRVRSYGGGHAVTVTGAGPFVINCGGGTVRFEPEVAGTNTFALGAGTTGFTLTSGTLDVSAFGATGFTVAATATAIIRDAGSLVGTPAYTGSAYTVTYTGASKTAGGEVPASLTSITLSMTTGATATFPSPITFAVTGGGLSATTATHAVFSGLVTLTSATAHPTATIVNNQAATWTFAGGITITSRWGANGVVVHNTAGGMINVTGPVTLTQAPAPPTIDAAHVSFFSNTGAGSIRLTGGVSQVATGVITGVYVASRTPVIHVENMGTGTLVLGGAVATTINGNLTTGATAGTVTIAGSVTVGGTLTNGAGHTIALGSNTLTVSGPAAHSNAGTISSAGIGVGLLNMTAATAKSITGSGALPNTQSSGAGPLTIPAATTIAGNLVSAGTGGLTVSTGTAVTVSGSLLISAGTLTTNPGGMTTGTGVTLSAGGLTLGGTLTVFGPFSQTGGTLTFGAYTLDIKGSFTRTAGVVAPGTGTLQFSAGGTQVFAGGANMSVNNFVTTGVGTGVTFTTGSLIVTNNATIGAGTSVSLGTLNIRMTGSGGTFTNSGTYSSVGGGGIIFEGAGQFIGGTGVYTNIEVRQPAETDFVDVVDGTMVTWSGILTLTRGTVRVGNGVGGAEQFNPSAIITTPTIRRNLNDTPPAGPDGRPIIIGADGTFNAPGVSYHLEYFGVLTAHTDVGPEFISGPTPRVINLTISTTPITFGVTLTAAEYRFSGNLTVGEGALLRWPAGASLVSTGSGVTHSVVGQIARVGGTGVFRIDGTGVTITGPPATAAAPAGRITETLISAGASVTVAGVREFTDGLTNAGTLTLGLATVVGDATSGRISLGTSSTGNAYMQTSTLTLTAHVTIAGPVVHSDDAIHLGAFNLTATGASYTRAPVATATYTATTGFLILSPAAPPMAFNLNGGSVPRLRAAGSVTFAGSATVTDRYEHTAGTVHLGANHLTISGSVWLQGVTDAVYTATTGNVRVTGATTLSVASAGVTVPNLEVATPATFTIANTGPGAFTTLTISTLLTHTSGTIALGVNDIVFTNAGLAYTYAAGSVTATTSAVLAGPGGAVPVIGEFVFGKTGQTITLTASGLTIPNVRIISGGVSLAPATATTTMTIVNRLTFGLGSFGAIASTTAPFPSRVIMGDGAWIVRQGTGTLSAAPVFGATVNNAYTDVTVTTGPELTTSPTALAGLYIAPAMTFPEGGTVALAGGATVTFAPAVAVTPVVVNGTLTLASGMLSYGATRPLQIGSGALVRVENNDVVGTPGRIDPTSAPIVPLATYRLAYWSDEPTPAGNFASTDREWRDTVVTELIVRMGTPNFATAATAAVLSLHASRVVGSFILDAGTVAAGIDLAPTGSPGYTLTVTGTTTLTRGTIAHSAFPPAAGTLNVQGAVTIAAAAFAPAVNLQFSGAADQTVTMAAPVSVANLTLAKTLGTTPVPRITLAGPAGGTTLSVSMINFVNGLLITGPNTVFLPAVTQGFTRPLAGIAAPNASHIVGNVRKDPWPGFYGRLEFPVGTAGVPPRYRPVALTFPLANPLITATSITFNHVDSPPLGTVGFPIDAGGFIRLTGTAPFYWLGTSSVGLGAGQVFDIDLTAEGYTGYVLGSFGISHLRIVRRFDGAELLNPWSLQGGNYSNFISNVPVPGTPIVRAVGSLGGLEPQGSRFSLGVGFITEVAEDKPGIPTEYNLAQNYPNPFNPSTTIKFDLPKQSPVTLEVYNVLGQKVASLIKGEVMEPGFYKVTWNGTDDAGAPVPSGMYIYRIVADKFTAVKKMMLVK